MSSSFASCWCDVQYFFYVITYCAFSKMKRDDWAPYSMLFECYILTYFLPWDVWYCFHLMILNKTKQSCAYFLEVYVYRPSRLFIKKIPIFLISHLGIRAWDGCRSVLVHDDVIKCKHFSRYWPFVRGIHRSPVNSQHKGQWRGALIFSLICVWINGWVTILMLVILDAIAPIMTSPYLNYLKITNHLSMNYLHMQSMWGFVSRRYI